MHVALVSPEVAPFVSGGIAPVTLATAQVLAKHPSNTVDLFAPAHYRREALRLRALGVPAFRHARIRWIWVAPEEGDDPWVLRWARALAAALDETYAGRPAPDVVEFQDYLGTGALAMQAARDGGSSISDAVLACRVHSSAEMVQAIDGRVPGDDLWAVTHALERASLRAADVLLTPTDHIASVYRAFYEGAVAPSRALWPAFLSEGVARPTGCATRSGDALNLVYVGRMQAIKGVLPLAHAIRDAADADLTITMVGGDTDTAPDGGSMLDAIVSEIGDDARVRLRPARPRHGVAELVRAADAVLVPSFWECCPNVGLEALAANRPVIGSKVGSLQDMLVPGLGDTALTAPLRNTLHRVIETFAADPRPLRSSVAEGAPRAHFEHLVEETRFLAAYAALPGRRAERAATTDDDTFEALLEQVRAKNDEVPDPVARAASSIARLPDGTVLGA